MVQILQTFHSHNRNLILLLLIIIVVVSFIGLTTKKPWSKFQKTLTLIHLIVIDIQFAIGMVLYIAFSPFGLKAFNNPDLNVMKDAEVRVIAIEHLILMLVAWILIHMGYSKSKKAINPNQTVVIYYTLALILIFAGIPWSRL